MSEKSDRTTKNAVKCRKMATALTAALAALYLAFLALDLFFPALWLLSAILKGAAILLCFALTAASSGGGRTGALNLAAAGLTCAADMLLLFTELFSVGIAVFIAAQACRLDAFARPRRLLAPAAAAGGYALAGLLALLGFDALKGFALPYALLLLSLLVAALTGVFRFPERRKQYLCLTLGAALFILCDVCVAAINLLPEGAGFSREAGVLMWAFYLPSQTLFARHGGNR